MLLTNTQVSRFSKAFANDSSANIKLSKTQLHKIRQWAGFLRRLLEPLQKTELPLIENVLKTLAKSVLIPLPIDAAVHKKMFESGVTKLIISIEEMNDIMKTAKSLEESGLLTKGVSKTLSNKSRPRHNQNRCRHI